MSIGAAAVRDGFDSEHGGVYESGLPVVGPQSTVKVWWIQAGATCLDLLRKQSACALLKA